MRPAIVSSASKLLAKNWISRMKELAANGNWQEILSCHHEIKTAGIQFTDPSFLHPILKACSFVSFKYGESIHASMVKQGLDSFTSMGNSIMDFYLKSRKLGCAYDVFDAMRDRDSVSWNTIIHGHLDQCGFELGLSLFFWAKIAGFRPNIATLVVVIHSCRELGRFDDGIIIHGFVIRRGYWPSSSVQNSLLCLYADFGIDFARKLFDEMPERDVISWSVIIGALVQADEESIALEVFRQMVYELVEPDGPIMVTVLKACTGLRDVRMGDSVHGFIISKGFKNDLFVGNCLVDFYSKCDDVDSAFRAFNEMPLKNAVSWNSLLSGYVQNEMHSEGLELFVSMGKTGVESDGITLVNLLQICKYLVNPYYCKSVHSKAIRQGYESNELVHNSLIDSYAKCNCISLARILFSQTKHRDTVTWSTMIAAFTYCKMPGEAISVFGEMKRAGEKFNMVTALNLIEACSLFAELKTSEWAHAVAIRHGLVSDVAVGTAVLDMYSKCGAIEVSRKAFEQMPRRNVVSWSAMIAAYGMNGLPHDALSLHARMESHGLKPNLVTILCLLSACSHGGLVEEGLSLFENLVQEYGNAEIRLEHYSCLADLLARAGKPDFAMDLMDKLSHGIKPSASAWSAILSACRNSGDSEIGADALSRLLQLEPSKSAGYLLASNMYASDGSWSDAAKMRGFIKKSGVEVHEGCSLVHVNNGEKFLSKSFQVFLFRFWFEFVIPYILPT